MFCTKCGYEIPELARFCPNCGQALAAETPWWNIPQRKTYKENRSSGAFIVLSILTVGIYSIYAKCQMGRDIEEICRNDGGHTMSYVGAFILSMLTFGVFDLVWTYLAAKRIEHFMMTRYGVECRFGSHSMLTFGILSYVTFGVTRFICDVFLLENVNQLARCNNELTARPEIRLNYGLTESVTE